MDPFVRRLVERLVDPSQPLSRNRHFHTFDNVEGRKALRLLRRLKALQAELTTCSTAGGVFRAQASTNDAGEIVILLRLERLRSTRTATLDASEYELLCRLPGVREALR